MLCFVVFFYLVIAGANQTNHSVSSTKEQAIDYYLQKLNDAYFSFLSFWECLIIKRLARFNLRMDPVII